MLSLLLACLSQPPQHPVLQRPRQYPVLAIVQSPKPIAPAKSCPCSPQCTCGCNAGDVCECGNMSQMRSTYQRFAAPATCTTCSPGG